MQGSGKEVRRMTVIRLPTFNGYTVDTRLKEFRKVNLKKMKFIPFESKRGRKLLRALHAKGYTTPEEIIY
jgi:hypothetical protein